MPVAVIDAYGRETTTLIFQKDEVERMLDTSHLLPGMYVLKMSIPEKGLLIRKVSVVH